MKTTDSELFSIKHGILRMEGFLRRPMSEVEKSLYAWAFVDGAMFEEKEISRALTNSKPNRLRKGNQ